MDLMNHLLNAASTAHARRYHGKARDGNDFINDATLDGLTLSRSAGSVYYFNGSGVLTATGDNVAAFTSNGLFIEGQATNLVAAADYRDFSTWTGFNVNMGATTPTLIDGTTPASGKNEVVEDTTAAAQHRRQLTVSVSAAGKYTLVFFAKRGTGTRSLQLVCANSTDGNWINIRTDLEATPTITNNTTSNYVTVEAVGGWAMIIATGTVVTTGNQTINVYLHNGTTNTFTGDGTSSIIYDWATLVNNGMPQSPIQGAATRYASFIYRPWIGAVNNFWAYVDFNVKFSAQALTVSTLYALSIYKDSNNYVLARFVGASGVLRIASNSAATYQEADTANTSCDRGDRYRIIVAYDQVNGLRVRLSNNGAAAITATISTQKTPITALSSGASLYLGSIDGAAAASAGSYEYRAYKVGTGILTTAQMAEMVGA